MKFVADFFVAVFGWLFQFIAKFLGQRIATGAILTVAVAAASLVLYGLIQSLISGLISLVSDEYFLMAFYVVWPSNAPLCITACFSSDIAVFLYKHKIRLMTAMALRG
jgi:TM2 domain-containing membrane protein YozV